jgi:hypothetical protein
MLKSKTLGTLTVQIPDQNNRYVLVTDVCIPLLEGGLLYSGVLSPVNDNRSAETQFFVSNDILKSTITKQTGSDKYEIGIGPALIQKNFELLISNHSDDVQSFYGTTLDVKTGKIYKFSYTSTGEPTLSGASSFIILGIATLVGSLTDIVGLIANWQCKRVKVGYGLNFNGEKKELNIGCKVDCIEK